MYKEQSFDAFTVSVETCDVFPKRTRDLSFFELIYIMSGEGRHCLNENKYAYKAGDLFVCTPGDSHDFNIEVTTKFFFLRFNDIFLTTKGLNKDNVQRMEYLLNNAKQAAGSIVKNESDRPLIRAVVESIMREHVNRGLCWNNLTLAMVNTLLVLVSRNIEMGLPGFSRDNQEDKATDILHYIQANIYYPHLIRAEVVAGEFGISMNYLGRYFKKHTGSNMQDYIADYKMKLIENRLMYSSMRIAEIVEELGFTDESHFNKFFKKMKGVNPSEYRSSGAHAAAV